MYICVYYIVFNLSPIIIIFSILQVAVCNLASIALNRYVKSDPPTFDFDQLKMVTKVIVRNLNKIVDVNYYPIPEVIAGFRQKEHEY